jgi:Protein of unknown function (DUF3551)
MKKLMTAGLALSGMFAAPWEVHAYVNYPWCIIGDTRGVDCVFASREQCAQDGKSRGFGGQCMRNPSYNPALPSVVDQSARSLQADRERRKAIVEEGPAATPGPIRKKSSGR